MRCSPSVPAGILTLCAVLACSSSAEPGPPSLTGRVVFSRRVTLTASAIYSMTGAGADIVLLKRVDSLDLVVPRVSPSGDRVAILGGSAGSAAQNLYLVQANGSGFHQVALPVAFGAFGWAPDGQHLVFGCTDAAPAVGEATEAICVVNADGTGFHRVNHSAFGSRMPAWSPDGSHIVFVSDSGGGDWELFSMTPAGTGLQQITDNAFQDWDPVWSPLGDAIAFTSQRTGYPGEIFVIAPDGSAEFQVTYLANGGTCPAWSATGTDIWFCSNSQINAVHPDSTGFRQVTTAVQASAWPSWGP